MGRSARLLAYFPHNQQSCSISGDQAVTARTPTASGSSYYIESGQFTWQESREHSFTLTCTNESGEPAATQTFTQMVAPKPPEPLIEINDVYFDKGSYSDFYLGGFPTLRFTATNMKSGVQCSADMLRPDGVSKSITGTSTASISVSTQDRMQGTYTVTDVSCTNLDGVQSNVLAGPFIADVKGAPKILTFAVDDNDIRTSETANLQWTSENVTSCDITNVESGETTAVPANGSFEFAARPVIGHYAYDLTCYSPVKNFYGIPINAPQRLTVAVSAEPYHHGLVSGQYLGEYHLFMSMRTEDTAGAMQHVSIAGNMCTVGENGELCPTPEPWTPTYFLTVMKRE